MLRSTTRWSSGLSHGCAPKPPRALALREGESALDVGCGTGLCLPRLRRSVGATGRVVGIDVSEAMLRRARRRILQTAWGNVLLVQADGARLPLVPGSFDAALCFYTHAQKPRAKKSADRTSASRAAGSVAIRGPIRDRATVWT